MELNYGNILNIIIESESLESPDWIWKARVGGDFYPGHWVCGCKLAGISGDYYNPDDIGNPLKVVALPPEEEPFYEYGGNPGEEDRRRFVEELAIMDERVRQLEEAQHPEREEEA